VTVILFRTAFEKAYHTQVEQDVKELKYIGELEFNFSQMTKSISDKRNKEFQQLKD